MRDDFLEWRDRLRPGRLPRTVNRLARAVSAGLNRAVRLGHVGNPQAWRFEALPDDEESETAVFLTRAHRKALIEAAAPDAAAFLRGLELSGARPKELAAATVADFDGERLKLSHRKGRRPKLRSRYVLLDESGIALCIAQSKDKLPAASLFVNAKGKPWRRDMWAAEVRRAITTKPPMDTHGFLPRPPPIASGTRASASCCRFYGVDALTVAAQTGTSLRMIERTYYKFIPSVMREKLAGQKARTTSN